MTEAEILSYAALAVLALVAGCSALAAILVRAWYLGRIEDRDARADTLVDALVETMRAECGTATVERAEHAVRLHREARAGRRPDTQRGRHAR